MLTFPGLKYVYKTFTVFLSINNFGHIAHRAEVFELPNQRRNYNRRHQQHRPSSSRNDKQKLSLVEEEPEQEELEEMA